MRPHCILPKDRIILPLDFSDTAQAQRIVERLGSLVGMFKFGLEVTCSSLADLMILEDGQAIRNLIALRALAKAVGSSRAFVDLKFHDIPNTVGQATAAIARTGAAFINVHASAGLAAMQKAVVNKGDSKILVVTLLTSLGTEDLLGLGHTPLTSKDAVVRAMAELAVKAGVDGFICSPQEIGLLRSMPELKDAIIVTPGIRAKDAPPDDQKRTMTAGEAVKAGADYIVVGRPITAAQDPFEAARRIADEIRVALAEI